MQPSFVVNAKFGNSNPYTYLSAKSFEKGEKLLAQVGDDKLSTVEVVNCIPFSPTLLKPGINYRWVYDTVENCRAVLDKNFEE
jgi:hypothetical protein